MPSGSDLRFSPTRFREWRVARNLKQTELAHRLHYSRTLITRIESGTATPTRRMFEAVEWMFPGTIARRDFFRGAPG